MNKVRTKIDRAPAALFGIVLASLSFFYGVYVFLEASCTLLGRGNVFIIFYGVEARLLSLIFIGLGIWLFSGVFLAKCRPRVNAEAISWLGAVTLFFGLCSLVFILSKPLFK